jgi:hypothetical protein
MSPRTISLATACVALAAACEDGSDGRYLTSELALAANDCETNGAICLPLDPHEMYPPCPDGLYELPLGCPQNETSVCCGIAEDPGPAPMEELCASSGGVCWGADESGNVACPEGLEARAEIPCSIEGGVRPSSVCCIFVDRPPPPPADKCPSPNDPQIKYMGDGPEICDAIEYLCGDEGSPFVSPCGCGCLAY